jgi:hypothetical protein
MRNQRRSHSLQPINRAQVADPDSQHNISLVSTQNLTQVLQQQTAIIRPFSSSCSLDSTQAPPLERSPPVTRQTTSRPARPPPPPPRPPPYTSSIFDHLKLSSHQLNHTTNTLYTAEDPWSSRQRLEVLFRGLIPDPTNARRWRSPLTFQPARTVSENIELLDDIKRLIIRTSELHQDIEVKLTRIHFMLLRQEFERQDQTNHF